MKERVIPTIVLGLAKQHRLSMRMGPVALTHQPSLQLPEDLLYEIKIIVLNCYWEYEFQLTQKLIELPESPLQLSLPPSPPAHICILFVKVTPIF